MDPQPGDGCTRASLGGAALIDPGERFVLRPVGTVQSPLADRRQAPLQGDEGAPEAWLVLDPELSEAWGDLEPGSEVIILTWLHRSSREVLSVHPRDDPRTPRRGVFSTRSPDRPNPIGLHRVSIVETEGARVRVRNLEAIDGTPILDIKPVLDRLVSDGCRFER
jgi:tRNA-Thr(GGU) m(6)t(6)A37 methyltransferase TsaA